MKAGMVKLIYYTYKNIVFDIKWFFEKVYMKYITHEIVNEDIFPLYGEDLPKEKLTKEQVYEFLEG